MKDSLYFYNTTLIETLKLASSLALELRAKGLRVEHKLDGSVLTNADLAINRVIVEALSKISDFPIVSEEGCLVSPEAETFWLIDPIDGTKPYAQASVNFAICIALIHQGHPILGMIAIPCENVIYTGINLPDYKDCFSTIYSENKTISSKNPPMPEATDIITILVGSPLAMELKSMLPIREIVRPSAVKFCMLAGRNGDAYIRIRARQMDWDIAAGQAIAEASGFICSTTDGSPITYPNPDFACPEFIVSSPYWYSELKETIADFLRRH